MNRWKIYGILAFALLVLSISHAGDVDVTVTPIAENINFTPQNPLNGTEVHFYTFLSGDNYTWDFDDGTNISGVNNTNHTYLIDGIYNVTLGVHNTTWSYYHKNVRVDRRIILLTPVTGTAGYNYFAWHGNSTNASALSSFLNLSKGYWIHKYNSTSDSWQGWFVGYNAGVNFDIDNWDAVVIVVSRNMSMRFNITYDYGVRTSTIVDSGYNIVAWSNYSQKNASELALHASEWVYKYNTTSRSWLAYAYGIGGDDFQIKPYDVIVLVLTSARTWNF